MTENKNEQETRSPISEDQDIKEIKKKFERKRLYSLILGAYIVLIILPVFIDVLPKIMHEPLLLLFRVISAQPIFTMSILVILFFLYARLTISDFEQMIYLLGCIIVSLNKCEIKKAKKSFSWMILSLKRLISKYKLLPYNNPTIKILEELLDELRQSIYPILEDEKVGEYLKVAESLRYLRSALIKKTISGLKSYMASLRQPTAFTKQDREVLFLHEKPIIPSKFTIWLREIIVEKVWPLLRGDPSISRFVIIFGASVFAYLFFIYMTTYRFDPTLVVLIFAGSAALAKSS